MYFTHMDITPDMDICLLVMMDLANMINVSRENIQYAMEGIERTTTTTTTTTTGASANRTDTKRGRKKRNSCRFVCSFSLTLVCSLD